MYELHQAIDDTRKRLSRLEPEIDRLTDTLVK